jgi:PadR family transcriptional regulator, regulatory protein PadR
LVLSALNEGEAHGYALARWVNDHSDGILQLKEGTLYPLLHQLEHQGLVSSKWVSQEKARPIKLYQLTKSGEKRLNKDRSDWEQRASVITRIISSREVRYGLV